MTAYMTQQREAALRDLGIVDPVPTSTEAKRKVPKIILVRIERNTERRQKSQSLLLHIAKIKPAQLLM